MKTSLQCKLRLFLGSVICLLLVHYAAASIVLSTPGVFTQFFCICNAYRLTHKACHLRFWWLVSHHPLMAVNSGYGICHYLQNSYLCMQSGTKDADRNDDARTNSVPAESAPQTLPLCSLLIAKVMY